MRVGLGPQPPARELICALSFQEVEQEEQRLHPQVVEMIWDQFGVAHVDLFTSESTNHGPLWFSLVETSAPLRMDAFANIWLRGLCIPSDPRYRPHFTG